MGEMGLMASLAPLELLEIVANLERMVYLEFKEWVVKRVLLVCLALLAYPVTKVQQESRVMW